mgnify:CR=1 FL=1
MQIPRLSSVGCAQLIADMGTCRAALLCMANGSAHGPLAFLPDYIINLLSALGLQPDGRVTRLRQMLAMEAPECVAVLFCSCHCVDSHGSMHVYAAACAGWRRLLQPLQVCQHLLSTLSKHPCVAGSPKCGASSCRSDAGESQ